MTNPEQHHERMQETRAEATRPEAHEASSRDGPRIYVASLSDYNHGILHGRWIEATYDPEAMQDAIADMLAASPTTARYGDVAEEWAIHDYEGFGELRLDESEALSTVARVAGGIRQHGIAFAAWVAHVGQHSTDLIAQFEDHYLGQWESVEAYTENMLNDLGAERTIDEAPQWLQPYLALDVAGFARDLVTGGDIVAIEVPDGGVLIFSP